MTNGLGTIIGAYGSGVMIEKFFMLENGNRNWPDIWLAFAIYALIVTIFFAVLFKHKHDPKDVENVSH